MKKMGKESAEIEDKKVEGIRWNNVKNDSFLVERRFGLVWKSDVM